MTARTSPPPLAAQRSRQEEQLRRFLFPSQTSGPLPLLLPLPKELQSSRGAWIQVDVQAQLILAQLLRLAVLPWYSKLTNDRELVEEIVDVIRHGLQRANEAMLATSGAAVDEASRSTTRLERFLLEDVPTLLRIHYVEVRRAVSMTDQRGLKGADASAVLFLASNPHPALSLDADSHLQVDEAYLDVLLLAILQGLLPDDHAHAHNEILIVIDVIKGFVRGQLRTRGSGSWVAVRMLLHALASPCGSLKATSTLFEKKNEETKWYDSANLLLGLNFVFSFLKTSFFYLGIVYLDLFTPADAEPTRRRSRRRRAEGGEGASSRTIGRRHWNVEPLLNVVVEALEWRHRILTRFVEEWVRIALAWGGNRLVERQIRAVLLQQFQPERLVAQLKQVHWSLLAMQNQPPPIPVLEPSGAVRRQEYNEMVDTVLSFVQVSTPLALLLGHDGACQRQSVQRALSPFLEPPSDASHASVNQVANARTLFALLECFSVLVNPALEG